MTAMRWLFVLIVVVVVGVAALLLATLNAQPTDNRAWEYLTLTYRQVDDNSNGLLEDRLVIDDRYRVLFPISLCDNVTLSRERAICLENTSANLDLYLNTLSGDGWEVQQILPMSGEQGGVEVYLRRRMSATQAVGFLTQLPNRVAAVSTVLAEASETISAQAEATSTQNSITTATALTFSENRAATLSAQTVQIQETSTASVPLTETAIIDASQTQVALGTVAAEAALATAVAQANANNTSTAVVATGTADAQSTATVAALATETQFAQATVGAQTTARFRANSTVTQIAANNLATADAQNVIAQAVEATVSVMVADASATALRESLLATGQARLQQGTQIAASITAQASGFTQTAEALFAGATASGFADASATALSYKVTTTGQAQLQQLTSVAGTNTAATQAAQPNLQSELTSTALQLSLQATLDAAFVDTATPEPPSDGMLLPAFQDALSGASQIQTLQAKPTEEAIATATAPANFETVRGSIIGNRVEVWSFYGFAGDEVVITVYGDFGKVVNLYRSVRGTDFLLQTEMNITGETTPIELRRTLLREGDHVVEIAGLAGESGDYYFTVEVVSN